MRLIALNYVFNFFAFDFLACIPGLLTLEGKLSVYPFKLLRILRLPRLLSFIESLFNSFKDKHMQQKNSIENIFKVLHTTLLLALILHFLTCAYIAIGLIPETESWINEL